jgi:transcriptional regulator GlxA family with amidase domain
VGDEEFLAELRSLVDCSKFVLSVCTGSALLAKAGSLTGRKATSNKLAFDWVVSQDPAVDWVRSARWVADGKFYTSSGVSAGIDMSLGFVRDHVGFETARKLATAMEFRWTEHAEDDPFAE